MDARDKQLSALEKQLKELRLAYDLYFQGLERIPPQEHRNQLHRHLIQFQGQNASAPTAFRYRITSLLQRFTSYDQMWRRQMVAVENGTSRRDKFRVAQNRVQAPQPLSLPEPLSPTATHPLEQQKLKRLHGAFLRANEMAGHKTNLTIEKLAASLKTQLPKLQKKHPGKNIDVKVVLKNGKPQLKAVVR